MPTLGRPKLLKEFIDAYNESEGSIPVWVLVHQGDPQFSEYQALIPYMPKSFVFVNTEEAQTMGDKVRHVWDKIKDFDWVMILNDDHRPRTKKWDQAVISQIQGHNIVFTNDGYVNKDGPTRIAGAICFSGKWLRALGYMFLPGQHHLYSDDLWQALCQRPQCAFYLHDVIVEHVHAYTHPELRDSTYELVNGPKGLNPETRVGEGGFWPGDSDVFRKWMESGQAQKDMQKIVDIQPRTGVMICTPSHDNFVLFEYALGMTDFQIALKQQNIYSEFSRVVGSSLIPHARNSLVDMFMKSKCQKLLFIDADQGFDAQTLWPLFSSPRRIIAGITPHKRFPINLNFEPLPEDKKYFTSLANKGWEEFVKFAGERADKNGEIEVNRAGTGIMCIDRSVFEIMSEDAPEYLAYDSNDEMKNKEYFRMGSGGESGGRYRGEDWWFCEMAKKHKIPIYIQSRSVAIHAGTYQFRAV